MRMHSYVFVTDTYKEMFYKLVYCLDVYISLYLQIRIIRTEFLEQQATVINDYIVSYEFTHKSVFTVLYLP